jgi:D-amino peptidase
MKVYVSFDMEGCSGITYRAQVGHNDSAPTAYSRAQRFATDDVKAAVEGVLEFEPDAEIWFNDAHGMSMNVFFEELPESVLSVVGSAELMDEVLGIDETFDAYICVGAHGNNMTQNAILSHVWDVREVCFNNRPLTETGLNAALAGFYGIPLVAMSGDEASINAIKKELGTDIPSAVVKKGLGRYSAVCLHPKKAQKLIKEAVISGLKQRHNIPPLTFKNPITVDLIHHDHFNAFAQKFFVPSDESLSPMHTRFIASDARDAYFGFLARDKLSKARHN